MRKGWLIASGVVAALLMAQLAAAAVIQTTFNKLGYRDFENIYDSQASGVGNGVFDVGDRLRGVLFLDKLDAANGVSYGGTDPAFPHEVTAIYDIELRHVIPEGVIIGIGGKETDVYSFLFGPAIAPGAAGTETAAAIGAAGSNGWVPPATVFNPLGPLSTLPGMPVLPLGTPEPMIVAYEGPPDDLIRATLDISTFAAEFAASNGSLQAAYTMLGDFPGALVPTWGLPGNGYWYAVVQVPDPIPDGLANMPVPIGFLGTTSFGFGLEAIPLVGALSQFPYVKLDNPELPIGDTIPTGTAIGGNVSGGPITFDFTGGGSATPIKSNGAMVPGIPAEPGYGIYHADSDDPTRVHPTPEPTTILIWVILGGCLAGAGWLRRRCG